MASELQTLLDIQRSGNLNPYQSDQLSKLQKSGSSGNAQGIIGGPSDSGSSSNTGLDVVGNAQKLLDFQKQANAPVVASLQTQQPGLNDKYTQLVNSIKGNQTLDTNRQTTTTNNLLAQRGISSNSNYSQQEMTNALTPIDTQYSGLIANANAGSISDTQALALQIAQLQAGNPETATTNALTYGGLQNQASQITSQNALNAAQASLASAQGGFYGQQGNYYTALAKSLTGGNIPAAQALAKQFGMV